MPAGIIHIGGTGNTHAVQTSIWIPIWNATKWQSTLTEIIHTGDTEYTRAVLRNGWTPMGNVPVSKLNAFLYIQSHSVKSLPIQGRLLTYIF